MPSEKKMNKTLLSYILTIGICAVAGAGTGVILKRTIGPIDETYPPGFDPKQYACDINALMDKYNALSDKSYNGLRGFSDADAVNVVLEKYRNQEYCWSLGTGNAYTIITQTIRNAFIKNGDNYFEEQLSYSNIVSVAKRSYQSGVGGNVDTYDGNLTGPEKATYKSSPSQTYTASKYKNYLGKTLDEMFIYIISDKTTVNSSHTIKGDDVIVTLELNPNLSTFYYKNQMKNLSGLSNPPPFSEVKLTYTFSKDLVLKHLNVDETYTATKEGVPVPAETHDIIDYYYHSGEQKDIPTSSESIDYKILED